MRVGSVDYTSSQMGRKIVLQKKYILNKHILKRITVYPKIGVAVHFDLLFPDHTGI